MSRVGAGRDVCADAILTRGISPNDTQFTEKMVAGQDQS